MINTVVNNGFQAKPPATSNGPAASGVSVKTAAPATSSAEVKQATPAGKAVEHNSEQLSAAVSKLNDYVQNVQRTLNFSIDKDTGVTVVKVFDSETKELVRQIPAEETLKLAASIDDQLANLFVQDRA
jgi:flagellar protein FlaG